MEELSETEASKIFYKALGLEDPWEVLRYEFKNQELHIYLGYKRGSEFKISQESQRHKLHDSVSRVWQHLDFFFQYKTFVHCDVARIKVEEDKIVLAYTPWTRKHSRFTLHLERRILELCKTVSIADVGLILGIDANRIWRVFNYYVKKEVEQIDLSESKVTQVGIDETSSRRGHNYVSVFVDLSSNKLLYVTEGKDKGVISKFKDQLKKQENINNVVDVCTDMSPAFIAGVETNFPKASITFDKFHVISLMNKAVDMTRREEQKDNSILKNTRYLFLKNRSNLTTKQEEVFNTLDVKNSNLKTARAYRLKLTLQDIYLTSDPLFFEDNLKNWYQLAIKSKIQPVRDFAKTVKKHWKGILNYATSKLTNAILESTNARIQQIKRRAKGFRHVSNFINMIYFVLGNLKFNFPSIPLYS